MHSTGLDLINDKYMGIFDELIEPSRQTYDAERGEAVDLAKSGPMSDFYGKLGFRSLLERITDETRAMEAAERAREAELARAAAEVGAPFAPRLRRPEDNAIRPPRTPPGPDLIDRYLPQPTHPQNPYTAEQAKVGRELLRGAADVLGLNPAYRALTTPLSEEEQKEFFFTEALPSLYGTGIGRRLIQGASRVLPEARAWVQSVREGPGVLADTPRAARETDPARLAARDATGRDPKPREQQPITDYYKLGDFPNGPPTNAEGFLTHTPEGAELRAKYIAGRRRVDGADEGLTIEQMKDLIEQLRGKRGEFGRKPSSGMGEDVGYYRRLRSPEGWIRNLHYADNLEPEQSRRLLAHELAHLLSDRLGKFNVKYGDINYRVIHDKNKTWEHRRNLADIYDELNSPPVMRPQDLGYYGQKAHAELWADAIRAYLTDPNYIKTVAPSVAKEIRDAFNKHRWLRERLQFSEIDPAPSRGGGDFGTVFGGQQTA